MKKTLLLIAFLSITTMVFGLGANQANITIEETSKQLSDNVVTSITAAGTFYLSDNIPHAFQVTLTGDDIVGTNAEIKAKAKGKIKKLIQGFRKNQGKSEVKDNSLKESYTEDIE